MLSLENSMNAELLEQLELRAEEYRQKCSDQKKLIERLCAEAIVRTDLSEIDYLATGSLEFWHASAILLIGAIQSKTYDTRSVKPVAYRYSSNSLLGQRFGGLSSCFFS